MAGSVVFALATVLFAAFSYDTLVSSRAYTEQLYERGIQSLNRLQEAQRFASVLSERYDILLKEGNGSTSAFSHGGPQALTPVGDISALLKEAASDSATPETARRIDELLYPLSRLSASQGAISLRLASRELARIADSLGIIVSSVRTEVSMVRDEADAEFSAATSRNWIALGFVVAVGLALTSVIAWRFSRAMALATTQARAIASGDIHRTAVSSEAGEFRDIFEAIEVLQATCRRLQGAMEDQAHHFDDRMERHRNRFLAALDNMPQALCMLDGDFNLVVFNAPFAKLFPTMKSGMSARQILADRRFHTVLEPDETGEFVQETDDGEVMRIKRRGLRDKGLIVTFENVTEQHRASQRLEVLAAQDGLTELSNRRFFRERLDALISGQAGAPQDIAVISIDLNAFKVVNDTLGHPVGDGLLKAVGARLRAVAGRRDVVARLGGDEFAIIQVGSRQPEGAERLAAAIVQAMSEPMEVLGRRIATGAAVGVVPLQRRGLAANAGDADHVMQNCNLALTRAKSLGSNRYCVFEPSMREALNERRDTERDLFSALENDEFELFYQPFVHAARGAVSGFEALIRWRHPRRGMISPALFIPLAEEIGLIERIGVWTLRTACAQAAGWPGDLILSVNLSPVQFRSPTLVADVRAALAETGLPASRLQLEVTESLFLDDSERTLAILRELRSDGMIISMDDFGTGYSSLGYLSRFPFDKIKIDQSFVRDMTLPENMAIVRAVIGLGSALKMPVIAEGIETVEQLRMLRAEGCREMQGYLFSRPRPAGDLPRILAEVRAFWREERRAAAAASGDAAAAGA